MGTTITPNWAIQTWPLRVDPGAHPPGLVRTCSSCSACRFVARFHRDMLCPYAVAPCPVSSPSASASGTGSWADVEGQPSPLSPAASLGTPRPASGLLFRRRTQNSLKATVLTVTTGSGEGVQVEVSRGAGHLGVLSTWTWHIACQCLVVACSGSPSQGGFPEPQCADSWGPGQV